jgi:hypothetical protein
MCITSLVSTSTRGRCRLVSLFGVGWLHLGPAVTGRALYHLLPAIESLNLLPKKKQKKQKKKETYELGAWSSGALKGFVMKMHTHREAWTASNSISEITA